MVYRSLVRPLLFKLNPETAHRQAIRTGNRLSHSRLARWALRKTHNVQYKELNVEAMGLRFQNPVGLAAGFDKHAYIYPVIGDLGFGHMEIGSVSLLPWRGNPSPTLLRLPDDGGLINRLGLNSEGAEVVSGRLSEAKFEVATGLNLVKTADPNIAGAAAIDDYLQCFTKFHCQADWITLNLSCPNTVEGRSFEDPAMLEPFLKKLDEIRLSEGATGKTTPVLVKLSPDLNDKLLGDILALAQEHRIDGGVIANTTTRRENLKTSKKMLDDFGFGGLSGHPLKQYVQQMILRVRARTPEQFLIIACGGVGCDPQMHPAEEVWEYLELGATLVQLHTGLIYRGPGIAREINKGLIKILRRKQIPDLRTFLASRSTSAPRVANPAA